MATKATRREEVEATIEELNGARVRELGAANALEKQLETHRREQGVLQEKRLAACKLVALGQSNSYTAIEESIKKGEVKTIGLEALIAEAHERVLQLRRESEPFEQELSALHREAEIDRQARAFEELKRRGLDIGIAFWRADKNLKAIETELQTTFTDERIRNAATNFAVELHGAVRNNFHVSSLFSPEELKEFS
jgi:hypothetical protein